MMTVQFAKAKKSELIPLYLNYLSLFQSSEFLSHLHHYLRKNGKIVEAHGFTESKKLLLTG